MTGPVSSAGKPTPIRRGSCPECGMGIQRQGTGVAYCGWCWWPDAKAFAERMRRLWAKPRVKVPAGRKELR